MIPGYYFFLFIIFSYAFRLRDFGAPIYINLTYLCIPLAAYVAHRYRWQGVIVTALGGILLPIGLQTRGEIGGFPPALHVYLLSLVTALWVVRGELPEKLITWLKSPYIYGLALLVLPLSLRYFEIQFTDEQGVYFGFSLILMLFYLLFMLGFYRARFGMVATGLLIAVIIGFLINYFSLPLSGSYLRQNEISPYLKFVYYANNLDDLLIGLVSFFVGAQYRSIMQGDPQTRQTKLLTGFGVLIIIVMWMFNHYYFRISGESLKISSAYFVPVASLYFGLKFRANGIAIAFFVALVGVFVTAYLRGRLGSLYLHEFFYVLAFAILGKQLREHVTGETTRISACLLYAGAWPLALAGIIFLFYEEDIVGLFLFTLTVLLLVIASIITYRDANVWLNKFKKGQIFTRWASVTAVIGILYVLFADIKSFISTFGKAFDESTTLFFVKIQNMFVFEKTNALMFSIDQRFYMRLLVVFTMLIVLISLVIKIFRSYDKLMVDVKSLLIKGVSIIEAIFGKTKPAFTSRLQSYAETLKKGEWGFNSKTQHVLKLSASFLNQVRNLLVIIPMLTFFILV